MIRESLREFLLPREESLDRDFAREVERLSLTGLRVVSVVNLTGTVLLLLVPALFPEFRQQRDVAVALLFAAVGGAGLALSTWAPAASRARGIALAQGYVVAMTALASMLRPGYPLSVDMIHAHMPIIVTLSLLVHTVALPLKPSQTLGYGAAMLGAYLALTAALRTTAELTGMIGMHVLLELSVVLLGSLLSAVLYRQRASAFRARRIAEESFEQLKAAQSRLLLSRNAASQSRLAAALTHELATPLGAFTSALDTMRLAIAKLAPAETESKLGKVARDALRSAEEASERLQRTLLRMKSVTNLDGAEERHTDLNALWRDTVELLESEIASKAEVRLDVQPVPKTRCRPEQISAVFSNLLRNAAAAMDARGVIEIRTSSSRGEIASEVRDSGRGMPPQLLDQVFDPTFRVDEGRVMASNWGLFLSRRIVVEHGGDIAIASEPGRGTTVRLVLPVK